MSVMLTDRAKNDVVAFAPGRMVRRYPDVAFLRLDVHDSSGNTAFAMEKVGTVFAAIAAFDCIRFWLCCRFRHGHGQHCFPASSSQQS